MPETTIRVTIACVFCYTAERLTIDLIESRDVARLGIKVAEMLADGHHIMITTANVQNLYSEAN